MEENRGMGMAISLPAQLTDVEDLIEDPVEVRIKTRKLLFKVVEMQLSEKKAEARELLIKARERQLIRDKADELEDLAREHSSAAEKLLASCRSMEVQAQEFEARGEEFAMDAQCLWENAKKKRLAFEEEKLQSEACTILCKAVEKHLETISEKFADRDHCREVFADSLKEQLRFIQSNELDVYKYLVGIIRAHVVDTTLLAADQALASKTLFPSVQVELEGLKAGRNRPKTVVGVLEELWWRERRLSTPSIPRMRAPLTRVVLPNNKEMIGNFHSTWGELFDNLGKLEEILCLMIPPKPMQASWKLSIPPFKSKFIENPHELNLPRFTSMLEEKLLTPDMDEFYSPLLKLEELPTCPCFELGEDDPVEGLDSMSAEDERFEVPNEPELPKIGKQARWLAAKNFDGIKLLNNLSDNQIKEMVDFYFGESFRAPSRAIYKLVDFHQEAREWDRLVAMKNAARTAKMKPLPITLVNLDYVSDLECDSKKDSRDHLSSREEKRPKPVLEDFLLPLLPEPAWDEAAAKAILLTSEDITRFRKAWIKRTESLIGMKPLAERKGSLSKFHFKQWATIPGLVRKSIPAESGVVRFAVGQRYAFVQFKEDLGPSPLIDTVLIGGKEWGIQDARVQVHDCSSTGFILHLEFAWEEDETLSAFKPPLQPKSEQHHSARCDGSNIGQGDLDEKFSKSGEKKKRKGKKQSSKKETLSTGMERNTAEDTQEIYIRWRALHTDWHAKAKVGVKRKSESSMEMSVTWNPQRALDNGVVADFPSREKLVAPPLSSEEAIQDEVELLLRTLDVHHLEPYCPPSFPDEEIQRLQRLAEYSASARIGKGAVVIVLDTSEAMLEAETWFRVKYFLRSFLEEEQPILEHLYERGGSLSLVALGANAAFQLARPDMYQVELAQKWIAGLSTIASSPSLLNRSVLDLYAGLNQRSDVGLVAVLSNSKTTLQRVGELLARNKEGSNLVSSLIQLFPCAREDFAEEVKGPEFSFKELDLVHAKQRSIDVLGLNTFLYKYVLQVGEDINRIKSKWKMEKEQYDLDYQAKERSVREQNKKLLAQAKSIHEVKQARRLELREHVTRFNEKERDRWANWQWHKLATLAKKRQAMTKLNLFLAVASARRQSKHLEMEENAAALRSEASSCAVEVVVSLVENAMFQVSKNEWTRHSESKRITREKNEAIIENAKNALAHELELLAEEEENAAAFKTQDELFQGSRQQQAEETLQALELRKKERSMEEIERRAMAMEDSYARTLQELQRKLEPSFCSYLKQLALAKVRVHSELLQSAFCLKGSLCQPTLLRIPSDEKQMLKDFEPIASHQRRMLSRAEDLRQDQITAKLEEKAWKLLKEEFLITCLRVRDELNAQARELPGTTKSQRTQHTEYLGKLKLEKKVDSFKRDVMNYCASVEARVHKHRKIKARGWNLLLQKARFSSHPALNRLQATRIECLAVQLICNVLQQLEDEIQSCSDMEISFGMEFSDPVVVKVLQAFETKYLHERDMVNRELLRTLRARLGLRSGVEIDEIKNEADQTRITTSGASKGEHGRNKGGKKGTKKTNKKEHKTERKEGRGVLRQVEWKSFSAKEKLRARAARTEVEMESWMDLQLLPLLAGDVERQILAAKKAEDAHKAAQAELEARQRSEKREWEEKVLSPVKQWNGGVVHHFRDENERNQAKKREQREHEINVVRPLQEFNSSLEFVEKQRKAAQVELKLLLTFREKLVERLPRKELMHWSKEGELPDSVRGRVVPLGCLRRALQAAFSQRNLVAGSASRAVRQNKKS